MDRFRRKVKIIKNAVTDDDIEQLYSDDKPTLDVLKSVAQSEIPSEIDDVIESAFSEYNVEFGELDLPEKELIRIFVWAGRLTGTKIKWNILLTQVEEIILRMPTHTLTLDTPTPEIFQSCPECGTELRGESNLCKICGWNSNDEVAK